MNRTVAKALLRFITTTGLHRRVSDAAYLRVTYKVNTGHDLDLDNPRTFNEKLQWLKLHDRNPLYTTLVDKCDVKEWVAERIGDEYIVPTLGVWEHFDEIDFASLPDRFVLKCTHDSGGMAICRNRDTFDVAAAREKIEHSLSRNYFWQCREWPYKNVAPRIIAEEYLEPDAFGNLADYKLFHFNGGRLVTLVCEDRLLGAGMRKTFFDEEWRPLTLSEGDHPINLDSHKPSHFDRMSELADRLALGLPFCRVDFYESVGRLFFGEMTFYPNGGFERFSPASVDAEWGDWVDLSDVHMGV